MTKFYVAVSRETGKAVASWSDRPRPELHQPEFKVYVVRADWSHQATQEAEHKWEEERRNRA